MLSAIFGLSGERLRPAEYAFFRESDPWGFILFARNVRDRAQMRVLCEQLRSCVGRDAPIFIDQEGGRVQRMRPPEWFDYPSGADYRAARRPLRAVWLGQRLIAHDLREVGVTVSCAPVLDVPRPGADPIIGDRALGKTANEVVALAHAAMAGLSAGGVGTVIKHVPGHGRADVDSHLELPIVRAQSLEEDFAPFWHLRDAFMAMTAHVVYTRIDPERPITLSPNGIAEVVRGEIGFDGLLMTDDLDMRALSGAPEALARDALAAGCDLVLQCNGELAIMESVARGCRTLEGAALRRARLAECSIGRPELLDVEAARAELAELLA